VIEDTRRHADFLRARVEGVEPHLVGENRAASDPRWEGGTPVPRGVHPGLSLEQQDSGWRVEYRSLDPSRSRGGF
jgi:hypothetical protein